MQPWHTTVCDHWERQHLLLVAVVDPVNVKHLYNICKMLDQRRRRWVDVVLMLYTCFVFTGEQMRLNLCCFNAGSAS